MGILSTNSLDFEVPSNKSLVVIGVPYKFQNKRTKRCFWSRYEETQDRILITAKDITLSKPKISEEKI